MQRNDTNNTADDRNLWITLGVIAGLWPVASLTTLLLFPDIAWYRYVWLGFLLANLAVWPTALLAAAAKELCRAARVLRLTTRKVRRPKRGATPTLAME